MAKMADAACAIIGNIKEFRLNSEDLWASYVKRIRAFFKVNKIKEDVQTSYLITLVGNETYDLITVLCSPVEPETKSFDDLVTLVENHLNPKSSEIAERMKFRACQQSPTDTINEYLLRLKKLAATCKFKGQEALEENLRDQFIYGLRNDKYRQRLLTEREVTFQRAVSLASSLEAAEKETKLGSSGTGGSSSGDASGAADVYAVRSGAAGAAVGAPAAPHPAPQAVLGVVPGSMHQIRVHI